MKWTERLLLFLVQALLVAYNGNVASRSLVPKAFLSLPLGDVKPSGWLFNQLHHNDSEASLGKTRGFYGYLSHTETQWLTRPTDVYTIEGAGSHWFYDTVTTGGALGLSVFQSHAEQFLDYFLDTQASDGWPGPEVNTTEPRHLPGRFPFLLGAIQLAEAQPARVDRIVNAAHRFTKLVNTMAHRGDRMVDEARPFIGDFVIVLQWLYESHPRGQEELLLDTMDMLLRSTRPWTEAFSEENFLLVDWRDTSRRPDVGVVWRGKTMAKAFTSLAAEYRLSGNRSVLDMIDGFWDRTFLHHGSPSGLYGAIDNNRQRTMFAWSRDRTNLIVELLNSALYLYQVTGNPKYAEHTERIVHDALAAAKRDNSWGSSCSVSLCRGSSGADGPYAGRFGSMSGGDESCCTLTHPQGWGDFIRGAFLATPDGKGLAHVYLGPFIVNTTLADGNKVSVSVNTTYPYGPDTLTTTIIASRDFVYHIRIPGWSVGATMSVNGSEPEPCRPVSGLHSINVSAGTTTVALQLSAQIAIEHLPSGSVAVRRGALLYGYDALMARKSVGAEPDTYAIDPSTALTTVLPRSPAIHPGTMYGVNVAACQIASTPGDDVLQIALESHMEKVCVSAARNLTLIPYGWSIHPPLVITDFDLVAVPEYAE